FNVVTVENAGTFDPARLTRNFYATSSCGVCGKASLEALEMCGHEVGPGPRLSGGTIIGLPDVLRKAQKVFDSTGGLHAAGLFGAGGELILAREDVGRHNAVDKLVGRSFLDRKIPLEESVLMVSGRVSFEIMQKAVASGIPVVCAVSAPSSLAVEVARRYGVTLIGFLREDRFNVYAGEERILTP
ncbi:MAG: formate dehydrogenase accessory sulfurtransferase FdhD, partial [Actinomycetota bacterium]